jgi:hypothetical protein
MSGISEELSQARENWKKNNPNKDPHNDINYPLQFVTEKPNVINKDYKEFVIQIFNSITKGKIITGGEFQDWFYGEMFQALVAKKYYGRVSYMEKHIVSKWGNKQLFWSWVLTKFTR